MKQNETILIADRGRLLTRIALSADAAPSEEYAAEELRRHLCEMVGAPFSIRQEFSEDAPEFVLNDREAAESAGMDLESLDLGPEHYRWETIGNRAFLVAGGQRGVLYGVYDLLESLGCRWFTPQIARIPRRRCIELPALNHTGGPAFEYRDMACWECADPVWWVRNRMNGRYVNVPEYMGGKVSYGLFVHTFHRLVPPDEFFGEHPEYYPLIGGVRRHERTQLCLSNPDVLRIVTERVLEHMRADPKAVLFSVSQDDCYGWCECPACKAVIEEEGAVSGLLLRFVNAVAEQTASVFPDKLIDTLSYQATIDAPRITKPHKNVRVRLCPLGCCQAHEYGTCDDPNSRRFFDALQGWGRMTDQMYIWHYCTNFYNYPLPMPNLDELQDNINLYKRMGVYGVFVQGMGQDGGGAESMALRAYVLGKLLWKPDQPVWPVVDEFFDAFYGKAAPVAREYLDLFHKRVRQDRSIHIHHGIKPTHVLFDGDILEQSDRALRRGEGLVKGKERQRLRLLRGGITYARLFRTAGKFGIEGDVLRGEAREEDVREFENLVRIWRKAGIERVEEWAPLDFTVQKLRNRLVRHKVEWLKDENQSLAVVPGMGGRIHEWHAFGRQWLAPPHQEITTYYHLLYPMVDGYMDYVVPHCFWYQGWCESYRYRESESRVSMWVNLIGGLSIRRVYELKDGTLHISTRVKNEGSVPVGTAWKSGLHLDLEEVTAVRIGDADGGQRLNREQWNNDGVFIEGRQLRDGAVTVEVPGYEIQHRFNGEALNHAALKHQKEYSMVSLDLGRDTGTIEPDGEFCVNQQVRLKEC